MNTISIAAAAVTGARHLRVARNGQDAVAVHRGRGGAVVVVADGCGSGASSEVGARLGAQLFARAIGTYLDATLDAGAGACELARAEVTSAIATLAGEHLELLHDYFLFTLIAGVVTPAGAFVWALGDGAYSFGDHTRVLGPFADNQPPYVAYDLLGDRREAHVESAPGATTVIVATDGACDLATGLERFATERLIAHPDALRRQLAIFARSGERIDWSARRVVRTPAVLQDDCAIAIARRQS